MNSITRIGGLICAVVLAGTAAFAQSPYGQERARAIGELTDDAIIEALQQDGRVSMSGGFFEFDSADLSGTAPEVLFKVAKAMDTLKDMRLAIIGHTDSSGDFNYNVDLSHRRAAAVRQALLQDPYNVDEKRLVAMGAGPIAPVMSNKSEEGRALNRRVEFIILDEELMAN